MDVPEHDSVLAAGLIAAYRNARYRVDATPPFELAVDVHSAPLAALIQAQGVAGSAFITAWNPLGVELARGENEARQRRLEVALLARGLRSIDGFGADPGDAWSGEPSRLVLGVNRYTACDLGHRHEQNAVLWMDADAIPRLLLLR